ncbi:MAG TPA: hypothetical protein VEI02_08740 [Planctomycetota bacterium]|nr:hypothetical protein [Planctomycetota bacterium]
MNFGDFWQEHRRYVTATVAGLVGVFIVTLIIDALYDDDIRKARRTIETAQSERARALPPGVDLAQIKSAREGLEAEFDRLREALVRKPRPEMRLDGGVADPDLHYNAQLDRIRNGVLELCALRNIDVDQRLGLPDQFPASRGEIEHYLRGLDVVEQILAVCLAAEQRTEGGIARVERIEIEKAPKRGAATARTRPFLGALKVEMSIIGHPRAVDDVVRAFPDEPGPGEEPGRRVVVQDAVLRSLDVGPGSTDRDRRGVDPMDRRRVELRLSVLALDVDPEGKL